MAAKRFMKGGWTKYPTLSVFDNKIGRELNSMECINVLNELNEENEQLQKSLSASVKKNRKLQRILDKLGYEYIGDLK